MARPFPSALPIASDPVFHRSHLIGFFVGISIGLFSIGLFCIDYGRQRPSNDLPRVIVTHPD